VTDVVEARTGWWSGLPRWARFGLIAAVAVAVLLAVIVLLRVVTRTPYIPLGSTPAGQLQPGACLAEADPDLAGYTVVSCDDAHAQQVFATVDLDLDAQTYSLVGSALATFGDMVCEKYLEYRMFLSADIDRNAFEAHAIATPDPDAYAAGDTEALCAVAPASGGSLTGDLYRPMP